MDKLSLEKINMWKGKLQKLQKEYEEIMQKRGEAMQMGDLRENAAFQSLSEDADTWRARMEELKNIITKLEHENPGAK
ncbi:MAG: hypothetical protein UU73_C0004G0039 [Candidatus Daviesbacteria bacterium GW2011_GWA1_41_61]|uniref:Transcription elongation factor GreA/GreB N-terminal domain-containing protein n=1 Tax=Candidatus Daviesbacteria bacterium GW2011_GWA2_40_9 TaxID=1618424 RepID=A0A0G0U7V4_9BACT|nr:MAG: hypothetical protein UU26_C0031G0002 [Candidatus Daviesbacteria bacterium GW2011_GWC1_40_9]KKR83326.1 MAG: hypothetical protein UU29_C0006G0015 [Candidatus Daviesbacteria bacterium GW2011_GWA2_40_9]KKR93243.1 MAG: hypothetical protein UU44_C0003G0039 [Candidatus Daviesbacteria bacterium GW2011_GWB1_41_15]KKS14731.1 MAG: hypothetical protein UU73_C0004G0039 [Candidatus Daviesbacteria bacterium GW2011_GWA1_41_61]